MDVMEENVWQVLMFRKFRILYLYCVDPDYVSELSIPSLPFLKLKCLFGISVGMAHGCVHVPQVQASAR